MARRNDHTRETLREMALDAAWRIVDSQGAPALTARAVAAEIGYSPGTLYNLFGNLDDLIVQLNGRVLDALHARISTAPRGADPVEDLLALARAYTDFTTAHRALWDALFEYRLPEDRGLPDWYLKKIDSLLAVVEEGLARALPEAGPAALRRAARVLWCSVHGICSLALTGKLGLVASESVPVMVESLVRNYLDGLRNGEVGTTNKA